MKALPPRRLLMGLWQIRLLQQRLDISSCWCSSGSSSSGLSARGLVVLAGCVFKPSDWRLRAPLESVVSVEGLVLPHVSSVSSFVSGDAAVWLSAGLVTSEESAASVSCVEVLSADDGGGSAGLDDGAGGFSRISLRREELKHSCSKSPPSRWQSSFTMTSQSPSSSTSKFRCGSGSRFINTWGTSWGIEPLQRQNNQKLSFQTLNHSQEKTAPQPRCSGHGGSCKNWV